ncbi:hypothetical protein RYH73_06270 [Olivibacter sp. CPCC 100613]|uniref:hypothetical protein n=1 Tax=Olivibacter sp. CPCC 100613 TaxID=3079931 RepID=UPI002FF9152E
MSLLRCGLANFVNDSPLEAVLTILKEIKSVSDGDLSESRYFNQLRVLVQLRKLENQLDIAMEAITKFFKEERDPLFRRGEVKGETKKSQEFVANLLTKFGFSVEAAAEAANVSTDFVQKVRADLAKKKK